MNHSTLLRAGDTVLDNLVDVELNNLVGVGQSVREVLQVLAILLDRLALEMEGNRLGALLGHGIQNLALVERAGNLEGVRARLEVEVVDEQITDALAVIEVGKGSVTDIDGEVGSVGKLDISEEILLGGCRRQIGLAVLDLGALEQVQALGSDGLFEGDRRLAVKTLGLNLGLALDSDANGLIVDEPGVEASEGSHILNSDVVGEVNPLKLVGVGLGELDVDEGGVGRLILEVHDTIEGVDIGLDSAIGGDGGVEAQGVGRGGGVGDLDGVDGQLGLVDLVLSNLGDSNEDTMEKSVSMLTLRWRYFAARIIVGKIMTGAGRCKNASRTVEFWWRTKPSTSRSGLARVGSRENHVTAESPGKRIGINCAVCCSRNKSQI